MHIDIDIDELYHVQPAFEKTRLEMDIRMETRILNDPSGSYGVATISRLLKIIGLLCRISSLLWDSFAKETCAFREPTNRSHPISTCRSTYSFPKRRDV